MSPDGFLRQKYQMQKPMPASKPSPPMVPPTAAPTTEPLLELDDWVGAGAADFERLGSEMPPEPEAEAASVVKAAVVEPPRVMEALAERA